MFTTYIFHWITSEQGLMGLLAQNWLLGSVIIALIVFVETGLVFFPFLPGDSLLFATGAFLSVSDISPVIPWAIITFAAISGDSINFIFGRSWVGQWLIHRQLIKESHLNKTQLYFDNWGGPTISIGRFIPIVRTIAPFMAGLSKMTFSRFMLFNILGGMFWSTSLLSAGFFLCKNNWVRDNLTIISFVVVAISLFPIFIRLFPFFWKQSS